MLGNKLQARGHVLGRWHREGAHYRAICQKCGGDIEMRIGPKREAVEKKLRWWATWGPPAVVWIIEGSLSFNGPRCLSYIRP
jgi:hypothetical protein